MEQSARIPDGFGGAGDGAIPDEDQHVPPLAYPPLHVTTRPLPLPSGVVIGFHGEVISTAHGGLGTDSTEHPIPSVRAQRRIANYMARHERAILQFSGGKDSTSLLHLARPWLHRIDVYFCDPGGILPHVREFVAETCRRLGVQLTVVGPDMPAAQYTEIVGLPSEVVPIENEWEFTPYFPESGRQLIQSHFKCCAQNFFYPMNNAVMKSGATLVLRGSKRADPRISAEDGFIENGITYGSPLWDWTRADVLAYLKAEGVALPHHYATVDDSLGCWFCTGWLSKDHSGEARVRFIREAYPHLWPELQDRLQRMWGAVNGQVRDIGKAAEVAMQDVVGAE